MKRLIKAALVVALVTVGAIGWIAWQNKEVRHEGGWVAGTAKGKVNQELVKNADKLAERLRAVQRTAATNQETKGK